ncbi:AMP-binding protein [Nocardia sp. NBC_00565]|uniref:AMP-binding protein n=1 Tax=Nocardia sp. NBC_00565 TaxID=2975993 RepID=UPI002E815407|nr:AMP-binding protein [Nocardia sp. NBC_00565]WUC05559.1 AMP-binding protein [Nocardia sp. NBC_00565]
MTVSADDPDARAQAQHWYATGTYGRVTLPRAILNASHARPDFPVVFHSAAQGTTLTLAELVDQACRCAAAFHGLGVEPGDAVAVQVPSWVESVVAQAAALLVGAVLVPVVPIYGPHELGFILRESRARVLVTPDHLGRRDYLADLRRIGACPDLSSVVVLGDPGAEGHIGWTTLLHGAEPMTSVQDASPDDVCLLVYTSGTTGQPKGVQHTHNTLLAEMRTALTGTDPDSVVLAAFPSGHVAGTLGLLRMLTQPTRHIVMDTWDASTAARLIDNHGVTATGGTPFFLTTLLDLAERGEADLSSLREYGVGGASVPSAVIERAHQHGIAAFRAYGSSEHPSISGGSARDALDKRTHTDGRLLDGVEIRIVDDTLGDLPPGREGEILSRGPELFVGYRDHTLDSDALLPGRWFRTGDIGTLDPDGYLTITDRRKDIIIRGGENLSSKQIEDVLANHEAVADVAVVAAPDALYGERVCAFVVLQPAITLSLADIRAHFATAGIARQKTPERLEIIDSLPRTATGKVRKAELRQRLHPPADPYGSTP